MPLLKSTQGAPNKSEHPGTLQRLLRAVGRRSDPVEALFCPACVAADVAGYWKQAAAGDPQDVLYQKMSQRWAAVEIKHTTRRKPERRQRNEW